MPRPPSLPVIDWKTLFETESTYVQWLGDAEFVENVQRMEGIRKAVQLSPTDVERLEAVSRPVYVFAFAEDWCGDVVRHVPVLQKIADRCSNIVVKYVTREQHPEIFVRFLTNGGEAIPRFVFLSADFVECGNWGPMPERGKELIARGKACGDVGSARQKVAELYAEDSEYRQVIDELLTLIERASCEAP